MWQCANGAQTADWNADADESPKAPRQEFRGGDTPAESLGAEGLRQDFRFPLFKRTPRKLPFLPPCLSVDLGKPLADDLPHGKVKAVPVSHRVVRSSAIVVAKSLLVKIAEQVKRSTET